MSLTTTVQAWLGKIGPREETATTARAHIAAETSTDVDEICSTISPDVFFALPVRTRAGQELRDGSVLTDLSRVRRYYENRSGSYVVRSSAQLRSIGTDWYVFNETAATLLGTGEVNGVDATGQEWVVSSTVLFPTAPDGIRGEICATRHPMEDVVLGLVGTGSVVGTDLANAAQLDRFSLALRARDWDAAASEASGAHTLAVRLDASDGTPTVHSGTGRGPLLDRLPTLFGAARDLALLVRIATDWYVFAEYLLQLEGGGVRRVAVMQPIEGGRIIGTYGYGREEA